MKGPLLRSSPPLPAPSGSSSPARSDWQRKCEETGGMWLLSGACLVVLWWVAAQVKTEDDTGSSVVMIEFFVAFSLAVANGGNDIANAVGTSVGAGALSMKQALGIGCAFEFLGAIMLGSMVSKTISKGVIEPAEFSGEPGVFATLMFATVSGASLTTLLATVYGYPISATHGIVGGLVAVGWYAKGSSCIGWGPLRMTLVMWVLSPLLGLLASMTIQIMCALILQVDMSEGIGLVVMPALWILTLTVTCLFLFITGPKPIRFDTFPNALFASLTTGVVLTGVWYGLRALRSRIHWGNFDCREKNREKELHKPSHVDYHACSTVTSALTPTTGLFPEIGDHHTNSNSSNSSNSSATNQSMPSHNCGHGSSNGHFANVCPDQQDEDGKSDDTSHDDSHMLTAKNGKNHGYGLSIVTDTNIMPVANVSAKSRRYSNPNEEGFVGLLVLSAFTVAFAHGANDVGNAVGPLAVMIEVLGTGLVQDVPEVPLWCLCIGAVGFVVGILSLGSYTVTTVGNKIIKLTPSRSYATQLGAALAVLSSSALGMPVSTSHCLIGSVLGVGLGQHIVATFVKDVSAPQINFGIVNKILVGWVATIPLAMSVAVAVFYVARPYASSFAAQK